MAIARALASDPVLLLMDEPFSGLDTGVATSLRLELARHLAAYDGVCLLVTHDAIDALTLADRVLVLDDGRVVQSGTPRDVAARPRTEHVARLVGLNVLRDGDDFLAFGPGVVTVSRHEPDGSPRHRWRGAIAEVAVHGTSVRLLVVGRAGGAGGRDARGGPRARPRPGSRGVGVGEGVGGQPLLGAAHDRAERPRAPAPMLAAWSTTCASVRWPSGSGSASTPCAGGRPRAGSPSSAAATSGCCPPSELAGFLSSLSGSDKTSSARNRFTGVVVASSATA